MQKGKLISLSFSNVFILVSVACVLLPIVFGDHSINVCIFKKPETDKKEIAKELFDKYEQQLNNLQDWLRNGTYFIDFIDFDLTHPAVSIKGNLTNTTLSHLDEYDLEIFQWTDIFKPSFQIFSFTFYNMSIEGIYDIPTGNIGDLFAIYGAGTFWLNIENFTVAASGRFVINETAACIPTDVTITTSSATNYFNHFMGDEEMEILMNEAITSLLPPSIELIWLDILGWNGQMWEDYINDIINNRKSSVDDVGHKKKKSLLLN